jgi:DNA polymerase-3 subunit epsilon
MQLKLSRPLIVFDLETTGVNTSKDRIVELAIIKLFPNGERIEKQTLLNPGIPIPAEASAVHGITDEAVKDKPSFRQISKSLLAFISGCDFLGYNCIRFDVPLLIEEFYRTGLQHPFAEAKCIDAFRIFCRKEERTLSAALKFYCREELKEAHSAHADTDATLRVLLGQLEHYDDLCKEVEGLSGYCQEEGFVDYNQKILLKDGEYLYNFGKHKGRRVLDETTYAQWMLKNDFPEDTKAHLRKIMAQAKKGVLK